MRKYRILEVNKRFYPQEKRWFIWRYIDNLCSHITWGKNHMSESECKSKDYAEKIIEARIRYLGDGKKIVHEYKQQDNESNR